MRCSSSAVVVVRKNVDIGWTTVKLSGQRTWRWPLLTRALHKQVSEVLFTLRKFGCNNKPRHLLPQLVWKSFRKLDSPGFTRWKYHYFLVCFSSVFFIFFAKCNLIRLWNTPVKFREAALSRCRDMWKLGGNINIALYGAFPIRFLWFFFAKRNLISLRNTPAKFCDAPPSRCRDMWKLGGNINIAIYGAFPIRFLWFFLLNVI